MGKRARREIRPLLFLRWTLRHLLRAASNGFLDRLSRSPSVGPIMVDLVRHLCTVDGAGRTRFTLEGSGIAADVEAVFALFISLLSLARILCDSFGRIGTGASTGIAALSPGVGVGH